MQKIFVMYKLKPGVSLEEYRQWSIRNDQRIFPFQSGVNRYEVYAIEGAERGEPKYQIIEDIEVESWEVWKDIVDKKEVQQLLKEWSKYGDEATLHAVYGRKLK